jgi:ferric-dicitrate binding protein FerR (iron transport regulator)
MARKASQAILAALCSILLVSLPTAEAGTPRAMGSLDTNGPTRVNGTVVPADTTIFVGDRIETPEDATASLSLTGGSHLTLGASSSLRIKNSSGETALVLDRGSLDILSRARAPIFLDAAGARLYAAKGDAAFAVAVEGNKLEVVARTGTVEAEAADRTVEVGAGKTLEATLAPAQSSTGAGSSAKWETVIIVLTAAGVGAAVGLGIRGSKTCRETASPFSLECR